MKDVVAEDERAAFIADEFCAEEKRLSDPFRPWLFGILNPYSPPAAVAEQFLEGPFGLLPVDLQEALLVLGRGLSPDARQFSNTSSTEFIAGRTVETMSNWRRYLTARLPRLIPGWTSSASFSPGGCSL